MAETVRDYFARVVALAQPKLTLIQVTQEIEAERSILTIQGTYLQYRVAIKETITSIGRRYAYYILAGNQVMLGLDNHADRQALRLKYGNDFATHLTELIPHQHGLDKMTLSLTLPWTVEQFLDGLDTLISKL